MKTIRVVAAVIKAVNKDGEPIIFATQRGYGALKDGWEFPGGMNCFWCEVINGDLVLKEHEAAKWLTMAQLNDVEWLPADITLIEKIRSVLT